MKNIKKILASLSLLAAPVAFGCPMHDNPNYAANYADQGYRAPMSRPMDRPVQTWMEHDRSMRRDRWSNRGDFQTYRAPASRWDDVNVRRSSDVNISLDNERDDMQPRRAPASRWDNVRSMRSGSSYDADSQYDNDSSFDSTPSMKKASTTTTSTTTTGGQSSY